MFFGGCPLAGGTKTRRAIPCSRRGSAPGSAPLGLWSWFLNSPTQTVINLAEKRISRARQYLYTVLTLFNSASS